MDQFVQSVGTDGGTTPPGVTCARRRRVMDYYDGNTVTGALELRPALRDERQLVRHDVRAVRAGRDQRRLGQHGRRRQNPAHRRTARRSRRRPRPNADLTPDGLGGYSLTSDAQPFWDDCSTRDAVALTGTNIGDELNAAGISWGWFQGGFRADDELRRRALAATAHRASRQRRSSPTSSRASFTRQGRPDRTRRTRRTATTSTRSASRSARRRPRAVRLQGRLHRPPRAVPVLRLDREPAPPRRPASLVAAIGTDTQTLRRRRAAVRHRESHYDIERLRLARRSDQRRHDCLRPRFRRSRFLKAPGYEDGHAAYSDPADEQQFVVREINALEKTPDWSSTAVVVNYDDSDGWYDHVYSGVTNPSASVADNLTNTVLGKINARTRRPAVRCEAAGERSRSRGEQGRCGFGPRLPLLVDLAVRGERHGRPQPQRPGLGRRTSSSTTGTCRRSRARSTRRSRATDRSEHVAVRPRRDCSTSPSASTGA